MDFLNSIGNWLLYTVWPMARDIDMEAWQAGLAGGLFTTVMALSMFGILSRITDFIFNATIILFIIAIGSLPVGLYLSAPTETVVGTIYMTITGAFIFICYALAVIVPSFFTLYALYKGEKNMNIPQAWSTVS